mgnify:CR=1 FL=1
MVKTKTVEGVTTYFTDDDALTIDPEVVDGEYPNELFLAMNNDYVGADTYRFKVKVGEDIYVGPSDRALTYSFVKGRLSNVVRKVIKTTAASTLTIADIADQTFTGSAIQPAVTVRDGEDVLTLGTDYSVGYTDNVNVGEATATITGLADAGATAATKYLGTKSKTFNIVKATPIIVMESTAMTLVNNATQNTGTRTRTRVFVDNDASGTWTDGDYDITELCTVTYASSDELVATVDANTGAVTAAGPGTCTITATVTAAANWNTNAVAATYTVNVEQEANGQNTVGNWGDGGTTTDKTHVE